MSRRDGWMGAVPDRGYDLPGETAAREREAALAAFRASPAGVAEFAAEQAVAAAAVAAAADAETGYQAESWGREIGRNGESLASESFRARKTAARLAEFPAHLPAFLVGLADGRAELAAKAALAARPRAERVAREIVEICTPEWRAITATDLASETAEYARDPEAAEILAEVARISGVAPADLFTAVAAAL